MRRLTNRKEEKNRSIRTFFVEMEKTAREAYKDLLSLIALRFPNALFEFKHPKVI